MVLPGSGNRRQKAQKEYDACAFHHGKGTTLQILYQARINYIFLFVEKSTNFFSLKCVTADKIVHLAIKNRGRKL
jgi:hypothetical protein